MGSYVKNNELEKANINSQLGENPDVFNLPVNFKENIEVKPIFMKQLKLDIADSFILGSATNGRLGTDLLGDRRVVDDFYVFPVNNIIEEDLLDADYINEGNTTATLGLDGTVTFADAEVLESDTVAKIRSSINSVKFTQLDYTGGTLGIEYSVDGGTSWTSINFNEKVLVSGGNADDDFKYRLTATGTVTLTGPVKIQINQ